MDNNAANSEKSQLIHEKNAKMYSLKLQRSLNIPLRSRALLTLRVRERRANKHSYLPCGDIDKQIQNEI
ncbi:hypothetical protein F2P81_024514 [Scophthalmus maximus]|uniref:Uncharacterized protein n=1 Tax=Scophthalmus maximus TaxID=52904 RepID=A0A6A4RZZ0_SCOMX|nr:hypothetical protein F2P81_024514 [Scophthalmus maximus]